MVTNLSFHGKFDLYFRKKKKTLCSVRKGNPHSLSV